jgi:VWFA-related protein
MFRSHLIAVGITCVLLIAAFSNQNALNVWAQSPNTTSPIQLIPRTKAQREQKYEAEHRISLIVQVTDSVGKPVSGLMAEDFSVFDNQKPQNIGTFREVDGKTFTADVHAVIVLDGINDGGSGIAHLKKDLGRYLSQGRGPLQFPISLAFVSENGETETPPSTDRVVVSRHLAQLARLSHAADCDLTIYADRSHLSPGFGTQGQASTAEERADWMNMHFAESLNALRKLVGEQENVRGRAILIWSGRGWPLLAEFGRAAVSQRGNYRDVLIELNTSLREAQVTLDAISWGDFETPKNVLKPIMSVTVSVPGTPDEVAEEAMALPALAQQNGGLVFPKVKNFANAMSGCLEDASDFYVLTFDSTLAAAADDFRAIEVKIDRPGASVRTASSYYAQP